MHRDPWQSHRLFPDLSETGHCASLTLLYALKTKHVVVLPPCPPAMNPCDSLQKWIIKRGNWPTKMNVWQRKVITLEIWIKNKWGCRRNTWLWECWSCLCSRNFSCAEELGKGTLDVNKRNDYDKKDKDVFKAWRKWQPTPVFLPGESQGWGSLVGCRLWGRTELDTTEAT